jgi:hypothetical protein
MTETDPPPLRLVRDGDAPTSAAEPAIEDYWARVQALRADLAALREAN